LCIDCIDGEDEEAVVAVVVDEFLLELELSLLIDEPMEDVEAFEI
jgi:hypothetical protein